MRFLALGDSYTIGEGVEPAGRWPVQLATALAATGVPVVAPEIVARTGWTTDELMSGIEAAHPHGPFALVTLLAGVNDQYRGRDTTEYRVAFRRLLARTVAFAGGHAAHVIVVSIPDWSVTPFAKGRDRRSVAAAIDAFNAINLEETLRARAHWVDVTPVSRRAAQSSELLVEDGLHPSAEMYRTWVELVLPVAREVLGGRSQ